MRVLLVTWKEQLLQKLSVLNPQLEYCAIVVDEIEPAKKILERVGLPKTLLFPMYDLKECVRDFHYDYVLCVENDYYDDKIMKAVDKYDAPENKLLNLATLTSHQNFLVKRVLNYYKEHATEFEVFATGISYTEVGLDVTRFKRKLFNFGKSSQDLYYDFQVAKHAIAYGGGHSKLKYALIGLAPYIFHYDLSKTFNYRYVILQYLIALNDLHNFFIPIDVYKGFFSAEYLSMQIPLEPFDINNPYGAKTNLRFMKPQARLDTRNIVDGWAKKIYPDTCVENVKILDDYLTLCEYNNIRPIMFLPPMTEGYMKHFNKQKLDEFYCMVRQACQKHSSVIFIDGWKLPGFIDHDFYDCFHLNLQGAAKFSIFLNNIIESL